MSNACYDAFIEFPGIMGKRGRPVKSADGVPYAQSDRRKAKMREYNKASAAKRKVIPVGFSEADCKIYQALLSYAYSRGISASAVALEAIKIYLMEQL